LLTIERLFGKPKGVISTHTSSEISENPATAEEEKETGTGKQIALNYITDTTKADERTIFLFKEYMDALKKHRTVPKVLRD
jgi:hypothetical protein